MQGIIYDSQIITELLSIRDPIIGEKLDELQLNQQLLSI
jgi:hypothetical protein